MIAMEQHMVGGWLSKADNPILIIEDERELAVILGEYLHMEGYDTVLAFDGEEGLKAFYECKPELVFLDIMLPKLDGIEVCKQIRQSSDTPILMLSAKSGELDKVISLGAGADDYVTKPFSPLELIARAKALLRRYHAYAKHQEKSSMEVGALRLYKESYEAYSRDVKLDLTTKEFEVLLFFAEHINQVFTREQIYEQVWGMKEYGDISSVAVYIKRIRTKLEEYDLDYIKTVWGVGYKLVI